MIDNVPVDLFFRFNDKMMIEIGTDDQNYIDSGLRPSISTADIEEEEIGKI